MEILKINLPRKANKTSTTDPYPNKLPPISLTMPGATFPSLSRTFFKLEHLTFKNAKVSEQIYHCQFQQKSKRCTYSIINITNILHAAFTPIYTLTKKFTGLTPSLNQVCFWIPVKVQKLSSIKIGRLTSH